MTRRCKTLTFIILWFKRLKLEIINTNNKFNKILTK